MQSFFKWLYVLSTKLQEIKLYKKMEEKDEEGVYGYKEINSVLRQSYLERLERLKDKVLEILTVGHKLQLIQRPSLCLGSIIWEGALVLAKYMEDNAQEFKGKTVIELGAGIGLVGIVSALIGCSSITITEIGKLIPLIRENIELNIEDPNVRKRVQVKELNWGEHVEGKFDKSYDYIVGSDIVYDKSTFEILIKSFKDLSDNNTIIFLAYRVRSKDETRFFELLEKDFVKVEIPKEKLRDSGRGGNPMHLYMMKKRVNNL